jgi:hypothetical protein
MAFVSRDELVNALKQMGDTEARQVFAEARGQDTTSRQEAAAAALRQYLRPTRTTEPDETE